EKKEKDNYNIGDKVIFTKDILIYGDNNNLEIEKNAEYEVVRKEINDNEINKENNKKNKNNNNVIEIILSSEKDKIKDSIKDNSKDNSIDNNDDDNKNTPIKTIKLDISKHNTNLNIYNKIDKELIVNDNIKWTNTNKEKSIIKNDGLTVKNIDKNKNTITLLNNKTNKDVILDLNNDKDKSTLKHIDYNYVTTSYSAQGKTSKNVILTLESYRTNLTTQKDFYVGISRVKNNLTIITDNKDKSLQALIGNTGVKIGASDVVRDDISISKTTDSIKTNENTVKGGNTTKDISKSNGNNNSTTNSSTSKNKSKDTELDL
ncbi:MAG: hypothetical protein LBQ13_00640, partial [Endomicrobium sp.]|nr:hypothetical protein [Endomicrobium sp.]